jgi:MarR family transcriptional regulator, organic hydroperoxide resistance regulator
MSDNLQLEKQLCFRLYSANKKVCRLYAPLLKNLGLTYPQYLVMLALWQEPEALSVKGLGQTLDLDSGTLSPLLKRMEKQQLLTRARDHSDERVVMVKLTSAGRDLKQAARSIPETMFAKTGLSAQQFALLITSLDQLMLDMP